MMRYAVVIEKAENNYSGYVPDLPGCVATGATVGEVEEEFEAGDPLSPRWTEGGWLADSASLRGRRVR